MYMEFSEEFRAGLNEYFDWEYTNIPNLGEPVLIIFNYSPSSKLSPFSFAFSSRESPKCWISHHKVKDVGGESPNRHQEYRDFNYNGQKFYAYSIQPLEKSTFRDITKFKKACNRLYVNIDWGEDG